MVIMGGLNYSDLEDEFLTKDNVLAYDCMIWHCVLLYRILDESQFVQHNSYSTKHLLIQDPSIQWLKGHPPYSGGTYIITVDV